MRTLLCLSLMLVPTPTERAIAVLTPIARDDKDHTLRIFARRAVGFLKARLE